MGGMMVIDLSGNELNEFITLILQLSGLNLS